MNELFTLKYSLSDPVHLLYIFFTNISILI